MGKHISQVSNPNQKPRLIVKRRQLRRPYLILLPTAHLIDIYVTGTNLLWLDLHQPLRTYNLGLSFSRWYRIASMLNVYSKYRSASELVVRKLGPIYISD